MLQSDLFHQYGLLFGAVLWGTLHGLTPHAHSWLVLLPFAIGGIKPRGMLRLALAFSAGLILTAAGTGALLGLLTSYIPEEGHRLVEIGLGGVLALAGLAIMFKPLSVHHAVDHICNEECQPGEVKALARTGTFGALFVLGAMSMLVPCPTNIWIYALPAVTQNPLVGMLVFTLYAVFTSLAITGVAVMMTRARPLVANLEKRGFRLVALRLGGLIVLGVGLWLLWLGTHEHEHEHEHEHSRSRPIVIVQQR
ncbi:MAG: urease accessory protein UreH domain-containing protein [Armatimonadota bacterium]